MKIINECFILFFATLCSWFFAVAIPVKPNSSIQFKYFKMNFNLYASTEPICCRPSPQIDRKRFLSSSTFITKLKFLVNSIRPTSSKRSSSTDNIVRWYGARIASHQLHRPMGGAHKNGIVIVTFTQMAHDGAHGSFAAQPRKDFSQSSQSA